ncbi:hypothetical protein [Aeromonas sp. s10]|uniref:hypothetical protein n=1 Tax=Aeromonas TaxID=642 RepID=UPI0034A22BC7
MISIRIKITILFPVFILLSLSVLTGYWYFTYRQYGMKNEGLAKKIYKSMKLMVFKILNGNTCQGEVGKVEGFKSRCHAAFAWCAVICVGHSDELTAIQVQAFSALGGQPLLTHTFTVVTHRSVNSIDVMILLWDSLTGYSHTFSTIL